MEAFFRQYAFLIVGSVLGIASLFLFLRRVLPAWRAARMQRTSSPSFSFQLPISALLGFSLGIIVMPFLSEGALLATVFLLMLLSILLGWVLIITNHAVRLAGWQKLVPSRMVKPLPASMVSLALLFFASGIAGIAIRILILTNG